MNSVIELLRNRRSIRKYEDRPVEKEKIDTILQAALMAPTEVLAQQHMRKISAMLEQYDVRCVLLTGAMSKMNSRLPRNWLL